MVELHYQRKPLARWKLIGRCTVSGISVLLSQFAVSLVPRFFSASPLLIQVALSALVLLVVVGFGRWCRRLVGFYASAPAFVFFNVLFVWAVYFVVLRRAVSCVMDIVFSGEVTMLIIGLCSIIASNPGLVTCGSSCANELVESLVAEVEAHNEVVETSASGLCHESLTKGSVLGRRIKYCRSCKAYIEGFDHHCPAFGNCIGQNNHALFMVLLAGFLATEASYVVCSSQFAAKAQIIDRTTLETSLSGNLAISTMLFAILQLVWQVVFMAWHIYCICFNIRTDEWVNWKKYPEFQHVIESQPGQSFSKVRFKNPYDKGILENVKEFLALEEK
ncbi:probable protein S-acyltransferase 15 isoform X3 [Corylus avellana]|uniref:probable protein S-acyltransferase 15 isoform X3 n=1 Tax=Corylus avellana TaxID=13451 RepID=UPI00286A984A|nr:probable protein S-acyltransferase 15 isoform X3 [Corylus avellana]